MIPAWVYFYGVRGNFLLTHSGRQIKSGKCCKIWSMPIFCGQILRLFIIGNLFINYDKAGMSSFWNKNMGMFPWEHWKMQFLSCFLKSHSSVIRSLCLMKWPADPVKCFKICHVLCMYTYEQWKPKVVDIDQGIH